MDTDDDLRLSRRILRDIEARGRDLQGVIAQYTRFVKPAQDRFVTPSRRIADVIIPWHECASLHASSACSRHDLLLGEAFKLLLYGQLEQPACTALLLLQQMQHRSHDTRVPQPTCSPTASTPPSQIANDISHVPALLY